MVYCAPRRILSEWCAIVAKTHVTVLHFLPSDRPLWQNSPAIPKRPGKQKPLGGTKFCHAVHYLCACRLQYTSLKYNLLRLVRPPRKEPAGSLFSFFNLFKQVHSDWKNIHCTWEKPMTLLGTSTKPPARSQFKELWKVLEARGEIEQQHIVYTNYLITFNSSSNIAFWSADFFTILIWNVMESETAPTWKPSPIAPAGRTWHEVRHQILQPNLRWSYGGVHLRPCYFLTWISVSDFQQLERLENH